jgi:Phage protein
MDDFIKSISTQEIQKITGEKPEKIKRWKKGITKIPESVIRLLKLYINGDASGLLGKDWEGYYFKDELFYVPEWRRGFTPHEIRALFWKCQQIRSLNNEINLLKQELERRNEEYNLLEIKSDFYKRQVILESQFGMILLRSFS